MSSSKAQIVLQHRQRALAAFERLCPSLAATGEFVAKPAGGSDAGAAAATTAAQWKVQKVNENGDKEIYGVRLFDLDPAIPGIEKCRDLKIATGFLSDAGLTPKTIAWDDDDEAFVREWSGSPVLRELPDEEQEAAKVVESLGKVFGELHKIEYPGTWTPHADIETYIDWLLSDDQETKREYLDMLEKLRTTTANDNDGGGVDDDIVLTHGDAKPGNLLRTDDDDNGGGNSSFLFIDLPSLGPRTAVEELAYAMFMWNAGTYAKTLTALPFKEHYVYFDKPLLRRSFVRSYLETRQGKKVTDDDVSKILWKIECHMPRTMIHLANIMNMISKDPGMEKELAEYAKQCADVFPKVAKEGIALIETATMPNANEQQRKKIIDRGLLKDLL